MPKTLQLFIWFFQYTLFHFNDGYDLHKDIIVNFSDYIPADEIEDRKQVLRDTPGPAGIKYACFIGSRMAGFTGALFAVLGVLLPIFAFTGIFIIIVKYLEPIQSAGKWIRYMLNGMAAAAVGLMVAQMIKAVSNNKPNRRTISFLAPFALFYLFAPDAMKNSTYYNVVFFLVIAVCSVIFAVSHIKISDAVEKRRNDPNHFYDPYSKKAVRERDRKLREEEEEMQRANKEKRAEREAKVKNEKRKWE